MIKTLRKLIRRLSMLRPLPARCSFCRRPYDIAGPFAEGYKGALICAECSVTCQELKLVSVSGNKINSQRAMFILLTLWVFFLTGFIPAFELGRESGLTGTLVGSSVGCLLGFAYAFAFWKFVEWLANHPPRKELSERAWMIIDLTLLPPLAIGLLFGLGFLSHVSVKLLLRLL
jgi:ClpX C4-type zinc finger